MNPMTVGEIVQRQADVVVPCWAYMASRRISVASPSGFLWWSGSEVCCGRSGPRLHRKSAQEGKKEIHSSY